MANTTRTHHSPFMEYMRFGITGILNTATDFIVLNGLLSLSTSKGAHTFLYIVCKGASFVVAVVQSYFLNKYWVFKVPSREGQNMEESARFFAVSAAGFVLNIVGSSLIYAVLGALNLFDPRLRANIGALAGTLVVLAWNYVGYKFFVFKTVPITPPTPITPTK